MNLEVWMWKVKHNNNFWDILGFKIRSVSFSISIELLHCLTISVHVHLSNFALCVLIFMYFVVWSFPKNEVLWKEVLDFEWEEMANMWRFWSPTLCLSILLVILALSLGCVSGLRWEGVYVCFHWHLCLCASDHMELKCGFSIIRGVKGACIIFKQIFLGTLGVSRFRYLYFACMMGVCSVKVEAISHRASDLVILLVLSTTSCIYMFKTLF